METDAQKPPDQQPQSPALAAQRRATMQVTLEVLRDALRLPGNVEILGATGVAGGGPVTLTLGGHGLPPEAAARQIRVRPRYKTIGVSMPDNTVEELATFDGWEVER